MKRIRLFAAVLLFALFMPVQLNADVECTVYNFSEMTWFQDYGEYYCAGYGLSCTNCWDTAAGTSCTANGSQPCEPKKPRNRY